MYARLVESRLRRVFSALNRGDTAPMLASLAPRFCYRFEGDSAIGGLRPVASPVGFVVPPDPDSPACLRRSGFAR